MATPQGGNPGYPQQGGYYPQQGYYPPPQQQQSGAYNYVPPQANDTEKRNLGIAFQSFDKDKNGYIDAKELSSVSYNGARISVYTAEWLIKAYDKERSQKGAAKIDQNEFVLLYKFITTFMQTFSKFDRDRNGFIDLEEVKYALSENNLNLDPETVRNVYDRFLADPFLRNPNPQMGLNMESFLALCAYIVYQRTKFLLAQPYNGYMNLEKYILACTIFYDP